MFWEKVLKDINNDPHSKMSTLFKMAFNKNVHYIRHQNIYNSFDNAQECYKFHTATFDTKLKLDVAQKTAVHSHSILDDYVI